jgi:hypothetical protein
MSKAAPLTAFVLLFCHSAIAQEPNPIGGVTVQSVRLSEDVAPILTGRIVDARDGHPVRGLQVLLEGTEIGGLTDPNGWFELKGMVPGTWILGMRLIGYVTETVELRLETGTVTQVLAGMRLARIQGAFQFIPPATPPPPRTDTVSAHGPGW